MKALILGGGGMLGHKLVQVLKKDFEIWTTVRKPIKEYEKLCLFEKEKTIQNVNVEDIQLIEEIIKNIKPEVIINAIGVIKQLPNSTLYFVYFLCSHLYVEKI